MSTTHNTPESASSTDQMDLDSPQPTRYHNVYAPEYPRPTAAIAVESPGSEMSVYTPTQTTIVPPPFARIPRPSPVPFPLRAENTRQQTQPAAPIITPSSNITVPVGQENAVFRKLCDMLDKSLDDWNESVSDYDKDHHPTSRAIVLNISEFMSEKIIYGKRAGKNQYWEGLIDILPGDARVVKLMVGDDDEVVYGVWVGMIHDFWECTDGVHAFYGMDKKMYVHPGSSWGEMEDEWEVFSAEGGWKMRDLGSDFELDDNEFASAEE